MGTGVKSGLTPCRTVGSAPDNKGMREFTIADGLPSDLGLGDIMVDGGAGTLIKGAEGDTDVAIGIFMGVEYIKADGQPVNAKSWASGTATGDGEDPKVKILDLPSATFKAKADGSVAGVLLGEVYAMESLTVDSITGRSEALVDISGGAIAAADSVDVEVLKILDADNLELEVRLARHKY